MSDESTQKVAEGSAASGPQAPPPQLPEFVLQSVCECQAKLEAELDADRLVLHGWASRRGARERAPANTVGVPGTRFDVVWHCPMCGRNTMRTFHEGALQRIV
jgi:hypothetical protein